jgi:hypothetical protein
LYNPERLPVTYVEAQCIEKRKRDGTFLLNGSDTLISISLTEAGRYVDDGWHMTGEERAKVKLGDPVIIHEDSGEFRRARYMGGESPYSAKIIYEGETFVGGFETDWTSRTTPVIHFRNRLQTKIGVAMPKRKLYADRSQKNTPDTLIGWLIALSPNSKSKVVVLRWKNFLGCFRRRKPFSPKCKVMKCHLDLVARRRAGCT